MTDARLHFILTCAPIVTLVTALILGSATSLSAGWAIAIGYGITALLSLGVASER